MEEGCEHYEVLGVARTATATDIRKAYFAKIRTHTPENDPEEFSRISNAYAVLSNAEKRSVYDKEERLPPKLQADLEAATQSLEVDPRAALETLRRLALAHPGVKAVSRVYGIALLKNNQFESALGVFRALSTREPDEAAWFVWIGISLKERGKTWYADALIALKAAIQLDKEQSAAYLHASSIEFELEHWDAAIAILDRGIEADGRVDAQDLPLFQRKLMLLALRENWTALSACAAALKVGLRGGDEPARGYASGVMVDLGNEFIEHNRFDIAHDFFTLACELHPENVELKGKVDKTKAVAKVDREKNRMASDPLVPDWLRTTALAMSGDLSAEPGEATDDNKHPVEKVNEYLFAMAIETGQDRSGGRRAAIDSARAKYPDLFGAHREQWAEFDRIARAAPQYVAAATSNSSSSNSGCVVLIAIFILFALFNK